MAQIFLSYASEDRPRAKAFAEALRDKGWTVFWDRTVPPGKVFDRVIDEALQQASCIVVLWSEASVDSNWVKEEITDAAQRGTLVPVLIDEVPLPLGFRRLQAARLIGWPDVNDANELEQLMTSIDVLVGTAVRRSTQPPPLPRLPHPRRRNHTLWKLKLPELIFGLFAALRTWWKQRRATRTAALR